MGSYKVAFFFTDKWLVCKQFTKDTGTSSKAPVLTTCILIPIPSGTVLQKEAEN